MFCGEAAVFRHRPAGRPIHPRCSTGETPVGPTGKMPVLLETNTPNMKTKTIILIVVSLIPLTAFSQPQPNPPTPPTPPNPPMGPQPPHDREDRRPKVPVTFL